MFSFMISTLNHQGAVVVVNVLYYLLFIGLSTYFLLGREIRILGVENTYQLNTSTIKLLIYVKIL
jgi:hypothetical protein